MPFGDQGSFQPGPTQMSQPHARVFQRGRFDRILLGLDHDPTRVSNLSQQAREAVEVDGEGVRRFAERDILGRGAGDAVELADVAADLRQDLPAALPAKWRR